MTPNQTLSVQCALGILLGSAIGAPWITPLRGVLILVAEVFLIVSMAANVWAQVRQDDNKGGS